MSDPASRATQPRVAVYANGERVEGLINFDVDLNTYYQADTFRVSLCLSAQPANRGFAWWSSQADIEMELLAGYPTTPDSFSRSDLVSLLVGNVDDIEIDPIADEITLAGRDLTSRFIDNKTIEKYQNLSASAIAIKLATSRGLTPVVTDTPGPVGRYYQIDHVALQDDRPEWDLLTYLANVTGNVVYVKGRELHFEPKPDPAQVPPYVLRWQPAAEGQAFPIFNGMRLRMSRNLTVAKNIRVTVRSSNYKQKGGFTVTANRARVKSPVTRGVPRTYSPTQQYSFAIPNLTPDEAQKRANQILKDISEHEMNMTAEVSGDPAIVPTTMVKLVGTETAYDQLYYPASVVHSFDSRGGYRTIIRGKNSSPESTVIP